MNRTQTLQLLLILFMCILVSCTDKDIEPVACPEFTSVSVSDIQYSTAKLKAEFSQTEVESAGFRIKSDSGSDMKDIPATVDELTIRASVENLDQLTSYTVSAYITNSVGNVIESEPVTFQTRKKPDPNDIIFIEDPVLKKWLLTRFDANNDNEISYLEGQSVDLIEMNADNVHSLVGIEFFPNLYYLSLAGSINWDTLEVFGHIEYADLSNNPRLNHVNLANNRLKTLILPENNNIDRLEIVGNELESIDVSCLSRVTLFSIARNRLTEIDLSGLDELTELHLDDNPLKSIVLDNRKLTSLECSSTDITELDLRKCPLINILGINDCPKLTTIYMTSKQSLGGFGQHPELEIIITDE